MEKSEWTPAGVGIHSDFLGWLKALSQFTRKFRSDYGKIRMDSGWSWNPFGFFWVGQKLKRNLCII